MLWKHQKVTEEGRYLNMGVEERHKQKRLLEIIKSIGIERRGWPDWTFNMQRAPLEYSIFH